MPPSKRTLPFNAFLAVLLLSGCGAVPVNEGAKNEPLRDGLKNPALAAVKVTVPDDQKMAADFESGTPQVNPKLYKSSGGALNAYSFGGNTVNDPFVVAGGAEGTKYAAHLFGTLNNKGDNQYPAFTLSLHPTGGGFYDAGAFSGIRFYYKVPGTDRSLFRVLSCPTAATLPVSGGGTCEDGCYDHYNVPLKGTPDWTLVKTAFADFKRAGWGAPVAPPEFTEHLKEIIGFEWSHNCGNTAGAFPVDFWVDEVSFY